MSIDWDKLIEERVENARSLMREMGLDALFVMKMDNVRYIADFFPQFYSYDIHALLGTAILPIDGSPAIVGGCYGGYLPLSSVWMFIHGLSQSSLYISIGP